MLGRDEDLARLCRLLEGPFPSLLIVGPPKSGKSYLLKEVLGELDNAATALVSCLSSAIRVADIFEDVLEQLGLPEGKENMLQISQFFHKTQILLFHFILQVLLAQFQENIHFSF